MDGVVQRAGMARIALEHARERREHLGRLGPHLAVAGPEVPRPQVHQRLGVDDVLELPVDQVPAHGPWGMERVSP